MKFDRNCVIIETLRLKINRLHAKENLDGKFINKREKEKNIFFKILLLINTQITGISIVIVSGNIKLEYYGQ